MDTYEATKVVFTRIQSLDPENASKIMGFILLQDQGEKEMIRLAFGPETLLLSLINKAKSCFGLSSNTSSATRGVSSPRIIVPAAANGFHHHHQHINPPSPSSPWSVSGFSDHRSPVMSPRPPASSLSYAAVVNGSGNGGSGSFSSSPNGSFQAPFYGGSNNGSGDLQDEYSNLPFLDGSGVNGGGGGEFMDPIMSPSGRSDSILFPYGSGDGGSSWADSGGPEETHHHLHRRSFSVSDVYLGGGGGGGSDDGGGGFGWRPCMYFARGFCKNGNTCKFSHGGFADSGEVPAAIVGSPSKFDGVDELLKMKAIQQQRFAAASQLMAAGGAPFPYNKCMNLLNDTQRSAAAALMMGDEFHKFGRCRPERNGFSDMGFCGNANSSSRQIYLTFPADSTFKEEDVSNYFSLYGPVQDVRIPYQQKRMFGFVTFVYAETVKIILAKGNPHFVCDSRVLVKPYKEKGKIPDKKQQGQQMDRGDFGGCLSPSALDNREPFDLPIGARMFYNTQEMLLRRKFEEQAELQHAIELQGRRMMNLQLMDLKNHHHNHQFHSSPSPTQSHTQSLVLQSDDVNQENSEENNGPPDGNNSPTAAADQKLQHEVNESCNNNNGSDREESVNLEDSDLPESLEHILPDNLFASPTKSAGDHSTIFSTTSTELEDTSTVTTSSSSNSGPMLPTTSTLNMASLQSCYFQMPRFSSGHEAIEM